MGDMSDTVRTQILLDGVEQAVNKFISKHCKNTATAYQQSFQYFSYFMKEDSVAKSIFRILKFGSEEADTVLMTYTEHLKNLGLSYATINLRLSALRSLISFMSSSGLINFNSSVKSLKVLPVRDSNGPTLDSVCLLLKATKLKSINKSTRDQALLRILFDLGLRRGEAVALDLADLDLDNRTVAVLGKGRTQKELLAIPEPTIQALKAWIAIRGAQPGALFTNFDHARKGHRLTGAAVFYLVREYGRLSGIKARPHGLRHSAITLALAETGGNLKDVKDYARLRCFNTLAVYDDHIRKGRVSDMVARGLP